MNKRAHWMIYGATGYTGSRIAAKAVQQGSRPLLAGRNEAGLRPLAQRLGLDYRVIDLADTAALRAAVSECSTVMHAAGPFVDTWRPMAEACLAEGAHYLDITGEVSVYENLAALDTRARSAGVMLMPGCGFDMVPNDCLALQLKRQMPDATRLDIAMSFEGTLTHGTIRSALATASPRAQVRRAHRLLTLDQPLARDFDFGAGRCGGRHACYAATLGDISIAWRTTGIPDTTTFIRPAKEFAALPGLYQNPGQIDSLPEGPSDEELAGIPSVFIGEVRNAQGAALAMRLVTPQVYAVTFDLAATIAQRVHDGDVRCGFQTPACVFGEDFILELDHCSLEPWTPTSAA